MELTGTYTAAGLALLAQTAAGGTLTVTRVAAGAGVTPNPESAAALPEEKQTLTLLPTVAENGVFSLTAVLTAALASADYTLTELGVFASGADGAEALFCVYRLDEPVGVSPASRLVLRFLLSCCVAAGGTPAVTATPAGLVTVADLLAERSLLPNRNLLDNWDFRNPVNQRGKTSYAASGYSIDRWKNEAGTLTVNADGTITFSLANDAAADWARLTQLIEFSFSGKTYTISADVIAASGTCLFVSGDTSQLSAVLEPGICHTSGVPVGHVGIQFAITRGSSVTLRAAKLEVGSVSTLANDPPADYGEELRKCQRYFEAIPVFRFYSLGRTPWSIATQTCLVPFMCTKRTIPVVSFEYEKSNNLGVFVSATASHPGINGFVDYTIAFDCDYVGFTNVVASADL